MTCVPFGKGNGRGIACFPDYTGQRVKVGGRTVYFDFSRVGGPLLTNSVGDPLPQEEQPVADDHPFWVPFGEWARRHGVAA